MRTAHLDSKFAKEAKTDAGNMAFLALLLLGNAIYYTVVTADVWWMYVIGVIAILFTAALVRRGVGRFYVIGVLVSLLERSGQ